MPWWRHYYSLVKRHFPHKSSFTVTSHFFFLSFIYSLVNSLQSVKGSLTDSCVLWTLGVPCELLSVPDPDRTDNLRELLDSHAWGDRPSLSKDNQSPPRVKQPLILWILVSCLQRINGILYSVNTGQIVSHFMIICESKPKPILWKNNY